MIDNERQRIIRDFHDRMARVYMAESLDLFDPGGAEEMRARIRRETEEKLGGRLSGWDIERSQMDFRSPVAVGAPDQVVEEDDGA